ncbi:MAG: gluconokinase [Ahrensia sp.]|nr:gluconokinase [Ahrensia sp.]
MRPRLFVVMGVAGSGKSSVGVGVAEAIGGTYIDGDDFHPQANIAKMASGQPLTDEDRWPWLEIVANALARQQGISLVGCSALKKAYRNFITKKAGEAVQFIYLDGSKELIAARMKARQGHFMPTSLLDSQFAALEVPSDAENHIKIDISGTSEQVIALVVNALKNQ